MDFGIQVIIEWIKEDSIFGFGPTYRPLRALGHNISIQALPQQYCPGALKLT